MRTLASLCLLTVLLPYVLGDSPSTAHRVRRRTRTTGLRKSPSVIDPKLDAMPSNTSERSFASFTSSSIKYINASKHCADMSLFADDAGPSAAQTHHKQPHTMGKAKHDPPPAPDSRPAHEQCKHMMYWMDQGQELSAEHFVDFVTDTDPREVGKAMHDAASGLIEALHALQHADAPDAIGDKHTDGAATSSGASAHLLGLQSFATGCARKLAAMTSLPGNAAPVLRPLCQVQAALQSPAFATSSSRHSDTEIVWGIVAAEAKRSALATAATHLDRLARGTETQDGGLQYIQHLDINGYAPGPDHNDQHGAPRSFAHTAWRKLASQLASSKPAAADLGPVLEVLRGIQHLGKASMSSGAFIPQPPSIGMAACVGSTVQALIVQSGLVRAHYADNPVELAGLRGSGVSSTDCGHSSGTKSTNVIALDHRLRDQPGLLGEQPGSDPTSLFVEGSTAGAELLHTAATAKAGKVPLLDGVHKTVASGVETSALDGSAGASSGAASGGAAAASGGGIPSMSWMENPMHGSTAVRHDGGGVGYSTSGPSTTDPLKLATMDAVPTRGDTSGHGKGSGVDGGSKASTVGAVGDSATASEFQVTSSLVAQNQVVFVLDTAVVYTYEEFQLNRDFTGLEEEIFAIAGGHVEPGSTSRVARGAAIQEPETTTAGSSVAAPSREGKAYMPFSNLDTHGTMVAAEVARGTQSIVVPIKIKSRTWRGVSRSYRLLPEDAVLYPEYGPGCCGTLRVVLTRLSSDIEWGLARIQLMAQRIQAVVNASQGSAYRAGSILGVVQVSMGRSYDESGKARFDKSFNILGGFGFVASVAAGSDGVRDDSILPCAAEAAICAGSVYAQEAGEAASGVIRMSTGSNWGPKVDIFANGERIPEIGLQTMADSYGHASESGAEDMLYRAVVQHSFQSGTSFASPKVARALTIMASARSIVRASKDPALSLLLANARDAELGEPVLPEPPEPTVIPTASERLHQTIPDGNANIIIGNVDQQARWRIPAGAVLPYECSQCLTRAEPTETQACHKIYSACHCGCFQRLIGGKCRDAKNSPSLQIRLQPVGEIPSTGAASGRGGKTDLHEAGAQAYLSIDLQARRGAVTASDSERPPLLPASPTRVTAYKVMALQNGGLLVAVELSYDMFRGLQTGDGGGGGAARPHIEEASSTGAAAGAPSSGGVAAGAAAGAPTSTGGEAGAADAVAGVGATSYSGGDRDRDRDRGGGDYDGGTAALLRRDGDVQCNAAGSRTESFTSVSVSLCYPASGVLLSAGGPFEAVVELYDDCPWVLDGKQKGFFASVNVEIPACSSIIADPAAWPVTFSFQAHWAPLEDAPGLRGTPMSKYRSCKVSEDRALWFVKSPAADTMHIHVRPRSGYLTWSLPDKLVLQTSATVPGRSL